MDVNWAKQHHSLWAEKEIAKGQVSAPPPEGRMQAAEQALAGSLSNAPRRPSVGRVRFGEARRQRSGRWSSRCTAPGEALGLLWCRHAHHRPRRLERLRARPRSSPRSFLAWSRADSRVSTVKHAHHAFDIDQPGKDLHTHRMAGATEVLVGSANRWALVHELRGDAEPIACRICWGSSARSIWCVVEGYKRAIRIPKLEVYRACGRQAVASSR